MIATAARISAFLLLLTAAFDALGASAQDISDPLRMGPCEIPVVAPPAECGSLRVPEDRGQPEGRQIELRIVRLRIAACPGPPASTKSGSGRAGVAVVVSGQWDPVTPPSYGARVAATLPNALHVVVPAAGHSYDGLVGSACVTALVTEFLRAGSAQAL